MEEVKERQAELSKMRALMFYQERKQHHMNKIKSKVLTCAAALRVVSPVKMTRGSPAVG